jgi:hypothetical protein
VNANTIPNTVSGFRSTQTDKAPVCPHRGFHGTASQRLNKQIKTERKNKGCHENKRSEMVSGTSDQVAVRVEWGHTYKEPALKRSEVRYN